MDAAIFLDRDGVLVADTGLITEPGQLQILPDVPDALRRLKSRGYLLLVVTNQAVVARGLIGMRELEEIHQHLQRRLVSLGAPELDAFLVCPHHPHADMEEYRVACQCRKPADGLLRMAIQDKHLDPGACIMVGDRISDVIAGHAAGCRTVQVLSGAHDQAPIVAAGEVDWDVAPDHVCGGLGEAADWILGEGNG